MNVAEQDKPYWTIVAEQDKLYWTITNDETQKALMSLLTDTSRVKIYREVKAEFERDDIKEAAAASNIFLPDEEVSWAQEHMEHHFDCNVTYWDNVYNAIQSVHHDEEGEEE